jgi:hypothetical protein
VLDDLRQALPVDIVLLGLHGAMAADGYAAGQTTINAAYAKPENWVDKLSNAYDKTMQDLLDRRVDWLVSWSTQ